MKKKSQIEKLTNRSKEIFRCLVETYLNTGEPVGSRTLAKNLRNNLSSSTIRNIMQDLEGASMECLSYKDSQDTLSKESVDNIVLRPE